MLAASEKTIFQGMNLLFFYAVGLGLPLILVATLCGNLPKEGMFWTLLRGKGWDIPVGGKNCFPPHHQSVQWNFIDRIRSRSCHRLHDLCQQPHSHRNSTLVQQI